MSKRSGMRRWKERAWARDPRCHWCNVVTVLPSSLPAGQKHQPDYMATVDHLRSRFDPGRRQEPIPGELRRVLACRKCNAERGAAIVAAHPIEEIRRRSDNGYRRNRFG